MKLLLVSVGEGRYAVAAEAVAQIMDPALDPKFHREPGAGELIYHGGRCPVVDLNGTVGDEEGGASLFLVLEGKGRRVMVPVDAAESIQEIPGTEIAPLPSFIFAAGRGLFRGLFSDGRVPRLLLDEAVLL